MFSQDKYQKAIHYAALAHGEQKYVGQPYSYVVHITLVAMEVIAAFENMPGFSDLNEDLAIQCAILHDTIEDTSVTYEDIKGLFGMQVADGVLALTKNKSLEKSQQIIDSLNRIKTQSKEIWMVKMADRITNLQKPPDFWSAEKITA